MSINSKSRRDAKKKNQPKLGARSSAPVLRPHAEILDGAGKIVGGAGLRSGEWVMLLNGREVAGTDSPGMVLAMLKHAASARGDGGEQVELRYSTELQDAATIEAQAQGKTLDEHLALLEAERVERLEFKRGGDLQADGG